VTPVVITPAKDEVLFRSNTLRANLKANAVKTGRDLPGVNACVPEVGYVVVPPGVPNVMNESRDRPHLKQDWERCFHSHNGVSVFFVRTTCLAGCAFFCPFAHVWIPVLSSSEPIVCTVQN